MSSNRLPPVYLDGFAFWSSRLPGWDIARAVIRGEQPAPEANSSRPAPTLLAPTERRRAPDTVAVALEVAARACETAGRPAAQLPSVFASTHGDLAISDYMCTVLASTPTLISPIKFHNSVHNAAAGYWSIGTGSYASYTAISAYTFTFGTGLLETATQVLCERRPVLYCAFDIEAKGALASMASSRGLLGIAMVIGCEPRAESREMTLGVGTARPTPASSTAFEYVASNALAPCFPFAEAAARLERSETTFALSEHSSLNVRLG